MHKFKPNTQKILILTLAWILVTAGCLSQIGGKYPTPTAHASKTPPHAATRDARPTIMPATATYTSVPATPTRTLIPTYTPRPTNTPTQTPAPLSFPRSYPSLFTFSQATSTGFNIFVAAFIGDDMDVTPVTDQRGIALWPTPSPNGRYIAYAHYDPNSDQTDIWLIDIFNDGSYEALTTEGNTAEILSWSRDSRYVVYSGPQADGSERDVYRVDINTGKMINLTAASPVWDAAPQCSPTKDQIVFVSDRNNNGKLTDNIWLMDINGGTLRQLTSTETFEDTYPSWSPDGTKIAFFRWGVFGDENEAQPGLIVLDIASGQETVLSNYPGLFNHEAPVWSPDGEYIAFQHVGSDDSSSIWIVPADGSSSQMQLADLGGENYGISWTPDSQMITFTYKDDDAIQLYIIDREGNNLQPLFPGDGNAFGAWFQLP